MVKEDNGKDSSREDNQGASIEAPALPRVTVEDVRASNGLEDFDLFAVSVMKHNLSPERVADLGAADAISRVREGSGRTTRRMCKAAAALLNGAVMHVPSGPGAKALVHQIKDLASETMVVLGRPGRVLHVHGDGALLVCLEGADLGGPMVAVQDHEPDGV